VPQKEADTVMLYEVYANSECPCTAIPLSRRDAFRSDAFAVRRLSNWDEEGPKCSDRLVAEKPSGGFQERIADYQGRQRSLVFRPAFGQEARMRLMAKCLLRHE
jgi:hypothetical protein